MDFRKYLIIIMSFIILTFIVLGFKSVTTIDIAIISHVQKTMSAFSADIPRVVGDLTYGFKFWIPVLVVSLLLIIKRKYVSSILIFFIIEAAYLTSDVLKTIIGRVRPPVDMRLIPLDNPSFPSGHSLLSMCFWGICIYLINRYVNNDILKWTLMVLCGLMIPFTGFTRLWLGVHYPTDLLGGYIIGFIFVLLFADIDKKLQKD